MNFDLATVVRRTRNPRRSTIVLRDIVPPAVLATNLYRSVYLPIVQRWEAAVDNLIQIYSRTLPQMVTDAASGGAIVSPQGNLTGAVAHLVDSPDELQARLDAASGDLERLFILLDAALRDWTLRTETWQREKWRGAVLSATGVDLGTMLGPEDVRQTLAASIAWNVSLVRDVNEEARKRMANIVFAGLNQRKPAADVAKELREAVSMSRARAQRIASDQLAKLTSSLADERQRQAGIKKVKWRSSHKLHARKWHAARDGKLFELETHEPVSGGDAVPAGDWVGQPPFCGCRTQAVLELE